MKKYVKPELFYEHFELTQHIADCAWELTNATKEICSAEADPSLLPGFVGMNLFLSSSNGCMLIPADQPGGNYEQVCYHSGAQGANVFAS